MILIASVALQVRLSTRSTSAS